MTNTTNLGLPCIEAAQAQKHVTHNEALRLLDTLVQLAVLDRDLNTPPGSPLNGQRWIVKASPAPTGAWAGHGNHVAAWQDGAWQFSAPNTGWVAFVADEGTLLTWNGTAWGDFFSTVTALQNLAQLGIGTTADATNPLSAKLNNTLWVARSVAEGGDGHLRYKLSKESAAKTLSLLFQDNFSGRAEVGLTGDDDFHFKVSADGSAWFEALRIDRASGKISFPVTGGPREQLTAARTYYVRTDGNDANSGLADSAASAFLTIQKAIDTVAALDLSTHQVTIQVGDGTYTGAVACKPYLGLLPPLIQGNAGTPANVIISTTSSSAITNDAGFTWRVEALELRTTTSGNGLFATGGGVIKFSNLRFGACAGVHIYALPGSAIVASGNYAVSGGAQVHAATSGFVNLVGRTITFSNSPNFSVAFILAGRGGVFDAFGMSFMNGVTVTGSRYSASANGVIFALTPDPYFPGNAAGSTATGGQYI